MAKVYGVNATKINDGLGAKMAPGEYNGKQSCSKDEYTFVAEVLAIADKVGLGLIPKGAKVDSVIVKCGQLGTTGIFKLGYEPTEDDVTDRLADLGSGYDGGGQAILAETLLLNDALAEDKLLVATFTEATDGALAEKLEVLVKYRIN
jgi:hypothetical protein